ncbi:MAG: hypothetical protein J7L88_02480, partial [Thermoplasmata archaeon]|nr:hypothetical protein [Thermoplasmata archaeon]
MRVKEFVPILFIAFLIILETCAGSGLNIAGYGGQSLTKFKIKSSSNTNSWNLINNTSFSSSLKIKEVKSINYKNIED